MPNLPAAFMFVGAGREAEEGLETEVEFSKLERPLEVPLPPLAVEFVGFLLSFFFRVFSFVSSASALLCPEPASAESIGASLIWKLLVFLAASLPNTADIRFKTKSEGRGTILYL